MGIMDLDMDMVDLQALEAVQQSSRRPRGLPKALQQNKTKKRHLKQDTQCSKASHT